jgi:hypothetical protein
MGGQNGKGALVAPFLAQSERRTLSFEAATAWSAACVGDGSTEYEV